MLEKALKEVRDRHKSQPIQQDQFDAWYRSDITQRLFAELEMAVIDQYQDYLPTQTIDQVALASMLRQGAAEMVEVVIDWSPSGVKHPKDKELDNED